MTRIIVGKVVVNIGVGKSGEPLEKVKRGLEELTGQRPTCEEPKIAFEILAFIKVSLLLPW